MTVPKAVEFPFLPRGKLLISTFNMTDWVLVYTQRDNRIAQDFLKTLKNVSGTIGMQVSDPQHCQLQCDQPRSYIQAIKE